MASGGITQDTKLMLHFNGDDGATTTVDDSDTGHSITIDNAAEIDTAQSKFGGSSLMCDPGGGIPSATLPDHADWDIASTLTEDWTIDFWAKHNSATPDVDAYILHEAGTGTQWSIIHDNILGLRFLSGAIVTSNSGDAFITDTGWHHVALVKNGSKYVIYLDGIKLSGHIDTGNTTSADGVLRIGIRMDGWMDEVRIHNHNYFNADPEVTGTIQVPTREYFRASKKTQPIIIS